MTADHDDECLCEDCGAEPKPGDVEWAMKQQQSFEYDNDLPLYDAWATLKQEVERLRAEASSLRETYAAAHEAHLKIRAQNTKLREQSTAYECVCEALGYTEGPRYADAETICNALARDADEMKRLRAENAELRERMSQLEAEANAARGQAEVFEKENAELREAVRGETLKAMSTREALREEMYEQLRAELDWFRRFWKHARHAVCTSDAFESEQGRKQALHFVMNNPKPGAGE